MPLSELKTLLDAERTDAMAGLLASKLSTQRSDAQRYYLGDMTKDMPVPEGRSAAVSTDVADTIEGLMPSLMEIFTASDDVVKFEPVGPEDVAAAEQETDYVNHVFMQGNPGFLILYSFIKDALLSKVGVVKVWWEEKTQEERETYYDQPEDVYNLIVSDPNIEILAKTERNVGTEDEPIILYDCVVGRSKKFAQARIDPVPPEEFGISRNARSLRDCDYSFHKVLLSEAKLLGQGYDKDQVQSLPSYTGITNTEEVARDTVDEFQYQGEQLNKAARKIEVIEHYIRMDYEGDGKALLYKVTTGGGQGDILTKDGKPDIEPFDMMPFAAMTPVIITHRFFGRSIADLVMDIQRIKTALLRSVLDNAYLANNPRVEVAQQFASPETLDDLLVSRPGGIVRTKQPGGLQWQEVPSIGGHVFPLMEYMDSTREFRTGVTRQGQGVDADALQNQSATAVNQVFSAAQARMKLIARIFAETGIRDLFALLHATIRKHGQEAATVRLRNTWVTVDPREWKTRNDMTIHVGLGTGGKQEQAAFMMGILNIQEKMAVGGLSNVATPKKIYNAALGFVKAGGHKDGDQFFADPEEKDAQGNLVNPPPPAKPDPEAVKAQAAVQQLQLKGQLDQQKSQLDTQHQIAKAQADMALAERKAALDERKMLLDAELKTREHHMTMAAKAIDIASKPGPPGPDGKPTAPPVSIETVLGHLAQMHNPVPHAQPKGFRVVRDQHGRVSHTEPVT
jgi:hypothetical protein